MRANIALKPFKQPQQFQSAPPYEGERLEQVRTLTEEEFQSAPPYEGEQVSVGAQRIQACFNPRPRMRANKTRLIR